MTTHSSTLAWKTPWMEEPGRLKSMGSRRVGHDWRDLAAAAATLHLQHESAGGSAHLQFNRKKNVNVTKARADTHDCSTQGFTAECNLGALRLMKGSNHLCEMISAVEFGLKVELTQRRRIDIGHSE